ncbi:serine/threonine protein kinase [Wenzhouxiangella sp. AB-CW3]|uniref:serine/threonine-protein kinase n=1 Tax=Wenzhouxiangella sp. AB-CW3 TaxID=2771012 RepID=UPI00168B2857|nr:serine/threonine-protein kinase [Wenzhouxiangella sp. AB-CW3]QOC21938.1 serine/threonine protein kinase [Wenzhouxiangella sp. AB-CW3]
MSKDRYDQDQAGGEGEDEATHVFQEEPADETGAAGESLNLPGYQVIRPLGAGGMGQVFLARQLEPVEREVAVKLIRKKILGPASEVRFLVERQALAQMRHPAIAQIFESGTNPDGYPYFAMEYVPGLPLNRFCQEQRLSLEDRIELFIRICQGVAHAHQKGIIHRDLKPANILVARIDGVPSPKIIDFGIAGTALSRHERRDQSSAGTPLYMSPEQFDEEAAIDVRSDVYSLGVILYELLSDQRPFEQHLFRGADTETIRHRLAGRTPEPLTGLLAGGGRQLAETARCRQTTVRGLVRSLRGELSAIAHRAVDPDPDQRYESASELAEELRRFLSGQPVRAMGDSRAYRIRCFLRRNALAATGVTTIMISLAVGLSAALLAMTEAQQQRRIAEDRQLELEKMIGFQQSMLGDLEPHLLGEGFVERLRQQYAQSFTDEADHEAVKAGIEAFEIAVGRINPTDLAQDLIDEFMLRRAIDSIESDFADEPLLQADLYETVRDVYTDAGMIDLALPLAERVVQLREDELGPDDARTLTALQRHYRLLSRNSEHERAGEVLDQVLDRMHEAAPDQLSLRHNAWDSRANLLVDTGQNDEAMRVATENIKRAEAELGPHHEYTIRAVNTLGYVHALSGDIESALVHFRDSADRARDHLESGSGNYYSAMLNVGAALGMLGRLEEALEIENEVYDILAERYGRRNRSTLNVMNNRAMTLMEMGRLEDAASELRQLVSLARQTYGRNHLTTLNFRLSLGLLHLRKEMNEEALEDLAEVATWREHLLTADHPDTLQAQHHAARAHLALGQLDQAGELALRAYRQRVEVLGDDHELTLGTALLLADVHAEADDRKAEREWRERIHAAVADHGETLESELIMNAVELLALRNGTSGSLVDWLTAVLDNEDESLDEARAAFAELISQ